MSITATGKANPETRFRIASLTKPFTAAATLRALDAAGLDTSAKALDLLPELQPDWKADPGITVDHLLAQTSGLTPALSGVDLADIPDTVDALLEACRRTVAQGSSRTPGHRWEYYNSNYFLAGAITATLHGTTYEQALTDLVLTPAGLHHTSFDTSDTFVCGTMNETPLPSSTYPRCRRPSGGLISTAADLLSFVDHLSADRSLLHQASAAHTAADDPMQYGYAWALGPSGQMYLNGRTPGYRAALLTIPDQHHTAVALAADDTSLPALARWISTTQQPLTGDDMTTTIDAFAA